MHKKFSEKSTKELNKMSYTEIFRQMKLENPELFQGYWKENGKFGKCFYFTQRFFLESDQFLY